MSDIAKRLRASVGFDAVNGNSHDRAIVSKQMREAVDYIDNLERDAAKLAKVREYCLTHKASKELDGLQDILQGERP